MFLFFLFFVWSGATSHTQNAYASGRGAAGHLRGDCTSELQQGKQVHLRKQVDEVPQVPPQGAAVFQLERSKADAIRSSLQR